MVVEVVRGKDGKRYPFGLPRPEAERQRICALIHDLHCRQGLSIHKAQTVMLEQHGIRRSMGMLHKYLAGWECSRCSTAPKPSAPPAPPDPAQRIQVHPWR